MLLAPARHTVGRNSEKLATKQRKSRKKPKKKTSSQSTHYGYGYGYATRTTWTVDTWSYTLITLGEANSNKVV